MLFEIFNWHSESLVFPHPTQKWSEVKKFQLRLLQHCKASFYLQPQGTQPSSLWPMTHVDHDSTTLDGHTTIHRIRRKDDSMKRLRYAKQAYIRWIKLGVCTSAVQTASCPQPRCSAAKCHSLWIYCPVQEWTYLKEKPVDRDPTHWGWELSR